MLILASKSPRRKALLESANIEFKTVDNVYDESQVDYMGDPSSYVQTLAHNKASAVFEKYPKDVILAADTIVVIDGKLLGKPIDSKDAISMLKTLSGKKHFVYTGVSIVSQTNQVTFVESAEVTMNTLSDLDIEYYVKTKEPMDKAGAYAIQGEGAKLVKQYEGDFHTIMGLPLKSVIRALKEFETRD